MPHRFRVVPGSYAVARLDPASPLPASAPLPFSAIVRTADELSIVCLDDHVPAGARAERGWALVKLEGPFPFAQVGVLASITAPLADAGISLFAVSTFDTDYVLVKAAVLPKAIAALRGAGHLEV